MTSSSFQRREQFGQRNKHPRLIIAHGDDVKTFTIRPWLSGLTALVLIALGAAYLGATAYLVLRDDILNAAIDRQHRLRETYEDRIVELRREIDRISSRQMLRQEAFNSRMDTLLSRQETLAERERAMRIVLDRAAGIGIEPHSVPSPEIRPADESAALTTGSLPDLASMSARVSPMQTRALLRGRNPEDAIAGVETALNQSVSQQETLLGALVAGASKRRDSIHQVVSGLGIQPSALIARVQAEDASASGGPFLPPVADNAFSHELVRLDTLLDEVEDLREGLQALPLRKPISGARQTSRFGNRVDPFLRRPAFHSGLDFAAPIGHPVKATAAGRVLHAGRKGGYGLMVEIDHGNGLITRYAHLSRVRAHAGQQVEAGTVIGALGNTGRSTGPHLHYETRRDGRPVDPASFLRAGSKLMDVL